jgi:hypothetical protein
VADRVDPEAAEEARVSFTQIEILEEFAEAARFGRRGDPISRVARFLDLRWWLVEGFKRWLPAPYPNLRVETREKRRRKTGEMEPRIFRSWEPPVCAVTTSTCPDCGAVVERREGSRFIAHLGVAPGHKCRRTMISTLRLAT